MALGRRGDEDGVIAVGMPAAGDAGARRSFDAEALGGDGDASVPGRRAGRKTCRPGRALPSSPGDSAVRSAAFHFTCPPPARWCRPRPTGGGAKTLTSQGSTAGTGEIAAAIINNSAPFTTGLTKSGTGTWTLSVSNPYSGTNTVNAGSLIGTQTSSTPFGTGAVTLNAGILNLAPTGSSADVSLRVATWQTPTISPTTPVRRFP